MMMMMMMMNVPQLGCPVHCANVDACFGYLQSYDRHCEPALQLLT
jgi:hypothetical protein